MAEDNKINLTVVTRFLRKFRIDITCANNGREALEKFTPGLYNLLLLDLEMPEMDGSSALKEIRKYDQTVPVAAFTAAIYENIFEDLVEKGFNGYIHKPFQPEELLHKIYSLAYGLKGT